MLTAERVRELLDYDAATGVFRWKVRRSNVKAGTAAGSPNSRGYLQIRIGGRGYHAHRLAWLYVTGAWPAHEIDHRNGTRSDNRLANLREATHAENSGNAKRRSDNTSGVKGVTWEKGKWRARIKVAGRTKTLGSFATPDEAHAAYCEAAKQMFGEFARAA